MRISIIGTGYVGLVTGVCFAEKGHEVTCVDIRKEAVDSINRGIPAIHEPGLAALLSKNAGKRLKATTDLASAVRDTSISFLCVGTPSAPDGSIDLSFIRAAARDIGKALKSKKGGDGKGGGSKGAARHVIVVKSTVVPGTAMDVVAKEISAASGLSFPDGFGICSNPEFLREGNAVEDAMNPDRIVIGSEDEASRKLLASVYEARFGNAPIVHTSTRTAEMIKYANNSLLSTLISFSNEIADICQTVPGVDVDEVLRAVTLDGRINPKRPDGSPSNPQIITYLRAGCGYGGSCFPKDVSALAGFAKGKGHNPALLESVMEINKSRASAIVARLKAAKGPLKGARVAVLGTAFKPDTDDIRESPAIRLIDLLLKEGAKVAATDPQALENTRKVYGDKIAYFAAPKDALKGADIAILVTKWKEFASISPDDFKILMNKGALLFDGRRFYGKKGFSGKVEYLGVGLG